MGEEGSMVTKKKAPKEIFQPQYDIINSTGNIT
jgi:hypothetical protein